MKVIRPLALLARLLLVAADHASPQQPPTPERPPIIDMHLHAFSCDHQGNPPPPNPVTGKVPAARTDKEAMEASLAELRRYNVVRAVAGGRSEDVSRWHAVDPERIIGGTMMPLPDVSVLREQSLAGRLGVMAELALPYWGVAPNDPQMEPYWALAEELDMPVGVHTGLAPPNTPHPMLPEVPQFAWEPGAAGGGADSTPEAARLPYARRLPVPARDESHHAHVPAGICGFGRD
jgi:hypothetical protein